MNYISIQIDDLQQYSRKYSLHIEGIEMMENETNVMLSKKVEETLNSLGANVSSADFVRLHRSSQPRKMKNGRTVAQTIVKFRNWSARSSAYETRFVGTWEPRKKRPCFVRLDLTKRRLGLMKHARDLLADLPSIHVVRTLSASCIF